MLDFVKTVLLSLLLSAVAVAWLALLGWAVVLLSQGHVLDGLGLFTLGGTALLTAVHYTTQHTA